jgi:hypothetical protein
VIASKAVALISMFLASSLRRNARLDEGANRERSPRQCPPFIAVEQRQFFQRFCCVDRFVDSILPDELIADTPHPLDIDFRFGNPSREVHELRTQAVCDLSCQTFNVICQNWVGQYRDS